MEKYKLSQVHEEEAKERAMQAERRAEQAEARIAEAYAKFERKAERGDN